MRWTAFIEEMSKLETKTWQSIVQKMRWAYRRRSDVPDILQGWFKFLPDSQEWEEVRKEISRRRKCISARNRYISKPKREALQAQRRSYMREYMRRYREKSRPQHETS